MRMQAGLPPFAQSLARARSLQPAISAAQAAEREAEELEFRRAAGWIL
jgi:hypothetical protein